MVEPLAAAPPAAAGSELVGPALFLLAALAASVGWARLLWYLDERSPALQRLVLFALGCTRRSAAEVRALLLSAAYFGCGLVLSALAVAWARPDLGALLAAGRDLLPLVLLGSMAEVALAGLLINLYCLAAGAGPESFAEVRSIPWMQGLRSLPAALVPWGAAVAAAVEELFFRGVLITVLLSPLGFPPLAAVAIAGALFCLQQLLQVRTRFQAAVIASGSLAISAVGGLLVLETGGATAAILCHAASVVFYLRRGEARPQLARS